MSSVGPVKVTRPGLIESLAGTPGTPGAIVGAVGCLFLVNMGLYMDTWVVLESPEGNLHVTL